MPKRLSDRQSQKILKYQQKIRKFKNLLQRIRPVNSDGNDLVEVFVEEPYEEPEIVHEADPGAPTISVLKEPDPEPQLDPDLLTALGETVDDSPQYGPHIHTNLAQRWQPILKKGLPKETKEKLLKTYLIPENCTLLQAPKINAEISAAVLDVVRNRDKKIEAAQQQLGAGITAINKGLTILLTSEDKVTATKHLSDACRILSDLHYMETQTRAKLVTPALSKQFLNVIQDCERDETLFGAKLPEKIKASKAIEKQGLQIKKIVKSTTGTSSAPTAPRAGYQGNWTAPSRYPSSRGGEEARGEQHRRRRAGRPPCRSRGRRARANHVQCSTKQGTCSIPFISKPYQGNTPINCFSQAEKADMQLAIQNLKDLGAITICSPSRDQYLSKIFLTPKPNGAKRFILNLKNLNKFVEKAHFKMEDYRTAARIIPKGGFMATIDLKEAYLLIPIAKPDRRYLRFQFEHENLQLVTYEFNAMPYGLSVAPRTFTKLMKEVVTHLRSQGFKSVCYLDDLLCIGKDYTECVTNVQHTVRLLECLGFIINYDKSSLKPQQCSKFLGFIYNSQDMTISLPCDKQRKILQLVQKFMLLPDCTICDFAQLIGVLVAACPAAKYGWLYTKILERQKFLALQKHHDYKAKIKLSNLILEDLVWWQNHISSISWSMVPPDYSLEIFSDASRTGWGGFCAGNRVNGAWKTQEMEYHINFLELLAVFLCLKCFAVYHLNCAILLRIDNTTAISYINRMGGVQFPHLNNLARQIWQWCEMRNIWLFASYINTRDNTEADEESRKLNPDTEWELSDLAFQKIIDHFGQPEVDLFASRANAKCQTYVSWKRDPEAFCIDAFTINWSQKFFYAFPPFSVIIKCVQKILYDKATGAGTRCTRGLPWVLQCSPARVLAARRAGRLSGIDDGFAFQKHSPTVQRHASKPGNNIGSNAYVKRLLKGAYKLRPSLPKYSHTWDPQRLLDYIADWYPNTSLTVEKITKKLVILLALCTAHRVQTLSLIKINKVSIGPTGVKIIITDIIKTSAAGRSQPILFLPYFREKPNICPATVLRDYIALTRDIRPENALNLLLTVKRPFKCATAQTIGRWIKQVMAESGVDVAAFGAHSTRHASTSAAAAAGVSVDTIRKTASWTNNSQAFAKFYHRQIIDEGSFARAVCHISNDINLSLE
ncbi:hypothetical protein MSG28_011870 [Choristoneura fumiferana]|uniref:Uncharacterized protein n=1 Tax=Choristoneura fumiferana TaxID=7141 RepID=A0ACC0KNH8_CHOFU|nr:hypothetical protein MSG28_011870 [Choristoneura fumiferana]